MIFKIKAALILLLLTAVILRIVLWAIEPAIPLAVMFIFLLAAYSFIFKRRW